MSFSTDFPGECSICLPIGFIDLLWVLCGVGRRVVVVVFSSLFKHCENITSVFIIFTFNPTHLDVRLYWIFDYLYTKGHDWHKRFGQPRRAHQPNGGPVFCKLWPGQLFADSCRPVVVLCPVPWIQTGPRPNWNSGHRLGYSARAEQSPV